MHRCATCHAPLADPRTPCAYCGTLGPEAQAAKRQQEAIEADAWERRDLAELEREHAEFARAEASMLSAATHAVVWPILGLVCCLPLGPLFGLMMARRARRIAEDHGLLPPARATWGLVLGAASLLLTVGAWGAMGWVAVLDHQRKAELQSLVEVRARAPSLDQQTACALVELEVLRTGYQSYSVVSDFDCDGSLEQHGDRAVLHDVRLSSSAGRKTFTACLRRGSRWTVHALRQGDPCDAAPRRQSQREVGRAREAQQPD